MYLDGWQRFLSSLDTRRCYGQSKACIRARWGFGVYFDISIQLFFATLCYVVISYSTSAASREKHIRYLSDLFTYSSENPTREISRSIHTQMYGWSISKQRNHIFTAPLWSCQPCLIPKQCKSLDQYPTEPLVYEKPYSQVLITHLGHMLTLPTQPLQLWYYQYQHHVRPVSIRRP